MNTLYGIVTFRLQKEPNAKRTSSQNPRLNFRSKPQNNFKQDFDQGITWSH